MKDCDKEFEKYSRQIALIVDYAGRYSHLMNSKNITLEFLTPNTTYFIQLLDMGYGTRYEDYQEFKNHYRGILVTKVLKTTEDNLVTSSTSTNRNQ